MPRNTPRLFLDADGVLADFDLSARGLLGMRLICRERKRLYRGLSRKRKSYDAGRHPTLGSKKLKIRVSIE